MQAYVGELPSPTQDRRQLRRDLDRAGYCLVANALAPEELKAVRARLTAQANGEVARGVAHLDSGPKQRIVLAQGGPRENAFTADSGGINQRVFFLFNKGGEFRDLILNRWVDELVDYLLGPGAILSAYSANIARPGSVRMGLHTDQWWLPQPQKPGEPHRRAAALKRHEPLPEFLHADGSVGIAPPVLCNVGWVLSEFTAENGATEFVPGTHLSGEFPDPNEWENYDIVQPEVPAGTAVVYDGRIWHGTGASRSGPDRMVIFAAFIAPQFRQQENYMLAMDRALWPEMSDRLKERMGFKTWWAYGRVEDAYRGDYIVDIEPHQIGEING